MNLFNEFICNVYEKLYFYFFYIFKIITLYISYYNNKYDILYYIFIIFIIGLISIIIFIKIKLGFWYNIPIKNKYTKDFFIKEKNIIIDKKIPIIDKWCNFIDIKTMSFSTLDKNIFDNHLLELSPNKSYISIEYVINKQFNNKDNVFQNINKLKNILFTIPINITNKNKMYKSYIISNEINNLTINLDNINFKLFKTHIYNVSNKNSVHFIFLFKTYKKLDILQDFITFSLYKLKINNAIKDKNIKTFYNFLIINKQNINLVVSLLNDSKKYINFLFLYNLHDILNLIEKNQILIYCLYFDNSVKSLYIFKKENSEYSLISSYNLYYENIFYYGFLKSIENIQKILKNINIDITIYDTYYNHIIIDNLIKNKLIINNNFSLYNKIHYYIYNYNYDSSNNNIITFF